jgi:hypothetical protein
MSMTAEETYLMLIYRALPRHQRREIDAILKSRTPITSKQLQEQFERLISIALTRRRNKS